MLLHGDPEDSRLQRLVFYTFKYCFWRLLGLANGCVWFSPFGAGSGHPAVTPRENYQTAVEVLTFFIEAPMTSRRTQWFEKLPFLPRNFDMVVDGDYALAGMPLSVVAAMVPEWAGRAEKGCRCDNWPVGWHASPEDVKTPSYVVSWACLAQRSRKNR